MKSFLKITIFFLVLSGPFLIAQEREIDSRVLESCVLGNLPQEIQFNVTGNPIFLSGKEFPEEKSIDLQSQLDGRLANLIVKSVSRTNLALSVDWPVIDDLNSEYVNELVSNMALYAPDVFGVEFCGQRELVANFILAQSFQYLVKASSGSNGEKADWLNSSKKKLNELNVVIIIVAIYLASEDPSKLHKFIKSLE